MWLRFTFMLPDPIQKPRTGRYYGRSWMLTVTVFVFLQAVCTLMLCLIILKVQVHGCNQERLFGKNCDLYCYCETMKCQTDDECLKGLNCQSETFGPYCQYWDLAEKHTTGDTNYYLTDGNENTCSEVTRSTDITEFHIILDKPYRFTWLRISSKWPLDPMLELNITFDETVSCVNKKKYISEEEDSMDITCAVDDLVQKIRIYGIIPSSICSLYLSSGRLVSLLQNASQSSFPQEGNREDYSPDNAVDGNAGDTAACAETDAEPGGAEWYIMFTQPYHLYRGRIQGSKNESKLLKAFSVAVYNDSSGDWIYIIRNPTETQDSEYDFGIAWLHPTNKVKIKAMEGEPLVLCEVYFYGDPVCPDNKYGLKCEESCDCKATDICNPYTGLCAEGCPRGFFGRKCDRECIGNCGDEGRCRPVSGECYICPPGFHGIFCQNKTETRSLRNLPIAALVSLAAGLVLFVICTFVIGRSKTRKSSTSTIEE